MPEREDIYLTAGLLLRRMRELAGKIGQLDLSQIREETEQIMAQWSALIETMKRQTQRSPDCPSSGDSATSKNSD